MLSPSRKWCPPCIVWVLPEPGAQHGAADQLETYLSTRLYQTLPDSSNLPLFGEGLDSGQFDHMPEYKPTSGAAARAGQGKSVNLLRLRLGWTGKATSNDQTQSMVYTRNLASSIA